MQSNNVNNSNLQRQPSRALEYAELSALRDLLWKLQGQLQMHNSGDYLEFPAANFGEAIALNDQVTALTKLIRAQGGAFYGI